MDGLASIIMGYGVSSMPMKYLGLPLEVSYKTKSIWNDIIEKIELLEYLENVVFV